MKLAALVAVARLCNVLLTNIKIDQWNGHIDQWDGIGQW
jgi:hypothetical protein